MKLTSADYSPADEAEKISRVTKKSETGSQHDKEKFRSLINKYRGEKDSKNLKQASSSYDDSIDLSTELNKQQIEIELRRQQFVDPAIIQAQQIQRLQIQSPISHEASKQTHIQNTSRSNTTSAVFEKRVKQLLVDSGAKSGNSEGTVMLRLDDDLFGATDLLLKRTTRGWELQVDTQDRDLLTSINNDTDRLAARFSELGIGEISVSSSIKL